MIAHNYINTIAKVLKVPQSCGEHSVWYSQFWWSSLKDIVFNFQLDPNNKLMWNLNRNTKRFLPEITFEKAISKMVLISFKPQYIISLPLYTVGCFTAVWHVWPHPLEQHFSVDPQSVSALHASTQKPLEPSAILGQNPVGYIKVISTNLMAIQWWWRWLYTYDNKAPFQKFFNESILDITLPWDMYINQDQRGRLCITLHMHVNQSMLSLS